RRRGDGAPVHDRQVADRHLPRARRRDVGVRRRRVVRAAAPVGLLLDADPLRRRRVHRGVLAMVRLTAPMIDDELPPLLLTEGGPGDALLQRLGLAPAGVRSRRAAVVLALVAWLPLLVLSAAGGVALTGPTIPFAYDLAAHVRFLIAIPLLL